MKRILSKKVSFIGFIILVTSVVISILYSSRVKASAGERKAIYNGSLTDSDHDWQNGIELTCSQTWVITAPCEDTITDGLYSGSTDVDVTYSGLTTIFE